MRDSASPFKGFPSGKVDFIRIPELFFSDLLHEIDHLNELKLTLFTFWILEKQETAIRFIRYIDYYNSSIWDSVPADQKESIVNEAIQKAIERNTLLCAREDNSTFQNAIFFLNTPRGRAALKAYQAGQWIPDHETPIPKTFGTSRPSIYSLYEENIGPLTPLMAEMLQEAESTYPLEWIEEAFRIAVKNNARKWRYIEAILRSWKEKGRYEENR